MPRRPSAAGALREIPRTVSTVWAIWRWNIDGGTIRNLGTQDLLSEDLYHLRMARKGARSNRLPWFEAQSRGTGSDHALCQRGRRGCPKPHGGRAHSERLQEGAGHQQCQLLERKPGVSLPAGRCIRSTLRWEEFASYRRTCCELLIFETSTNPTIASSPLELIFLPGSRRGLRIVAR